MLPALSGRIGCVHRRGQLLERIFRRLLGLTVFWLEKAASVTLVPRGSVSFPWANANSDPILGHQVESDVGCVWLWPLKPPLRAPEKVNTA